MRGGSRDIEDIWLRRRKSGGTRLRNNLTSHLSSRWPGDVEVQTIVRQLVHVEIALEDPFLHSIRDLGLRHLTGRRLHDRHTLRTVVSRGTQRRRGAGNGSPLGS